MQAQAQRGILEFTFNAEDHEPGLYMFHAHVSEFAELGWMSAFDVQTELRVTSYELREPRSDGD